MRKRPKIITLNEYNPVDNSDSKNNIIMAKHLGENSFAVIDDQVLKAIVEANGEKGEEEIIRMADRGQISIEDAVFVLGDRYEIVAKKVPCEWK
jgi:hypothetical protein